MPRWGTTNHERTSLSEESISVFDFSILPIYLTRGPFLTILTNFERMSCLRTGRFLRHIVQLFQHASPPPPQARHFPLTNLVTHLIIKISKGETIDEKRETKGRAYENWLRACLQR